MGKSKVILVDDHVIFRKGLSTILDRMENIEIIAEFENGEMFISSLNQCIPDLVFMDVRMPVMDGIKATEIALKLQPKVKIMALSMFGEEDYLRGMIEAGVHGFLLKNIKKPELTVAINRVLNGGQYYSPELIPYFTNQYFDKKKSNSEIDDFTPRELEILGMIGKGLTTQEIAESLFISRRTVEGHKANLAEKTGSKNVVNLLIYAIKHGIVTL